jgi:predicted nucleic acid-binding protein
LSDLVVDASVAVKWVLPEVHSDAALRLLNAQHNLIAPDLLYPEVGNVLWKRVRRAEITPDEAVAALDVLLATSLQVYPSRPLMPATLRLALQAGRTAYDCLYLALAIGMQCRMVTADQVLLNALALGPLAAHVVWIQDAT